MGKSRKNPESVEKMSSKWHGRRVKGEETIEEVETFEDELAELADLEELGVLGFDFETEWNITFKVNRPKLCCDARGKNLEIVGGDQDLGKLTGGRVVEGKRIVPIGWLVRIVYETDKHHLEGSKGYPESYEHYFAEEYYKDFLDVDDFKTPDDWWEQLKEDGVVKKAIEGERIPLMVYNITDQKISFVGGKYTVEDVGIKD